MKTDKIYEMLLKQTNLKEDDVTDYRACSPLYAKEYGVPFIPDAITMQVKNGTLIYIPKNDDEGNHITRERVMPKAKIVIVDGEVRAAMVNKEAEYAGLHIVIINGDTETDSIDSILQEMQEPGMICMESGLTEKDIEEGQE